jgi:two-component system, OmpR family, sensor kinase
MRTWVADRWPELGLALFGAANVWAMVATHVGQTVPFHFVWISRTLVYGYRMWTLRNTVSTLVLVCLVTGGALLLDVSRHRTEPAELTEVPLMAAVFLAMVWHTRRRQAAIAQVRRYAAEQEQLRERERGFLRDASHLLRTPVTVARGYTELLQAGASDEQARADAEVVLRELDSVSRISGRLLLLTATQLSELMEAAPLDVATLVTQAGQRWGPTTSRTVRVDVEECPLVGDWSLLESAVDAVVENALRYTGCDGTVSLSCRREPGHVVVEVADDGAGIAPDRLPSLFQRRWHPGFADERSGTGLGLAIVKAIVDAHGGTVAVRSAPGHGTCVVLTLPTGTAPASGPHGNTAEGVASAS